MTQNVSDPTSSMTEKTSRRAIRRNMPLFFVIITGAVLALSGFIATSRHYHSAHLAQIYQEQAAPLSMVFGRSLDRYLETVYSISGLYSASSEVNRDDFRAFVDRSLSRYPGIQALEWIPRVSADERTAFEERARQDGISDFQIRERAASGEMAAAARRDEFFPVYYVEPMAGNERAVGFDLASNPARRAALDLARDSGQMVGTQRIRLVQESGSQFGFLAFVPLYSTEMVPDTVADRRSKLTGFALGVFRIGDILQFAKNITGEMPNLDMYVFDLSAEPGQRFLHYSGASNIDSPQIDEAALLAGEHYSTSISVAGRDWWLVFKPNIPAYSAYTHGVPWSIAAAVILMTLNLYLYIVSARDRTRKVEQLVFDRTEQLRHMNVALKDETAVRQYAEQMLQQQNDSLSLLHNITEAANTAANFDDAVRVCLEEICVHLGWSLGRALKLTDDPAGGLKFTEICSYGQWKRIKGCLRMASGSIEQSKLGLIDRVIASGRPDWVADISGDLQILGGEAADARTVKGALTIPVLAGRKVVAVLECYSHQTANLDMRNLVLMAQIGTQLGRAAERAEAVQALRDREDSFA